MPRQTVISSPSRLHFGLFALETDVGGSGRSFGGLGAMIREPRVTIAIDHAERFSCTGSLPDRVRQFAEHWLENQTRNADSECLRKLFGDKSNSNDSCGIANLQCSIDATAPLQHTGLGVGTQLALAVAAALNAHFDRPQPAAAELALSMNRGRRSAVGSYGFATGGLIVDGGREPDAAFPDLSGRFDIPDQWRFVLVRPHVDHDYFGGTEQSAFGRLPNATNTQRIELARIAQDEIIPAVIQSDFDTFANALGRFNFLSGSMFAPMQGGAYHGPLLTDLVEKLQSAGFTGVGQSSWGPTLFVAAANETMASEIVELAKALLLEAGQDVSAATPEVASADNEVTTNPSETAIRNRGSAGQSRAGQGSSLSKAQILVTSTDNHGNRLEVFENQNLE